MNNNDYLKEIFKEEEEPRIDKRGIPDYEDLFNEISLKTCVEKRISAGGTGLKSVEMQIDYLKNYIK